MIIWTVFISLTILKSFIVTYESSVDTSSIEMSSLAIQFLSLALLFPVLDLLYCLYCVVVCQCLCFPPLSLLQCQNCFGLALVCYSVLWWAIVFIPWAIVFFWWALVFSWWDIFFVYCYYCLVGYDILLWFLYCLFHCCCHFHQWWCFHPCPSTLCPCISYMLLLADVQC